MKLKVPRGVGPGLAVGGGVAALRAAEGLATGSWGRAATPLGEVSAWLPWQLLDNVRSGRSPFDASVFTDGTASLASVVGNPGLAILEAPLHFIGSPAVAAAGAVLLLVVANAVAGGVYGAARGAPWLGALAASAAWWAPGFTAGTGAQCCLAPGLLAAGAGADRPRWAAVFTLLGAVCAPIPTAAVLLGAGLLPQALLAVSGLLLPALGTWGGEGFGGADLAWIGGRAERALPLGALWALWALGRDRGAGRAGAILAGGLLLWGLAPAPLAGFEVVVPWSASSSPIAAALAVLLAASLPHAAALRWQGRFLLGALLLLDAAGPVLRGGARLWHDDPPVPALLVTMASSPRSATVLVAPTGLSPAAAVRLIPHHHQLAARAPSLDGRGSAQGELRPEQVLFTLRQTNAPLVLVFVSPDAGERSVWASRLGAPRSQDGDAAVWAWP